ncbi:MAG TPA: hypothetical protein VGP38_08985, partial [Rubrobacter sp.]|nr:hypothetical protein [Rubrobacter sp.]
DLAYVFTDVGSGKAKRIRADPRVTLAPSDWRGRPLGGSIPATARFVDEAEEEAADRTLREKYGWQYALAQNVLGLLGKSDQHAFLELRRSAGGSP